MTISRRAWAVVSVLMLSAAGCSGDDDDDSGDEHTGRSNPDAATERDAAKPQQGEPDAAKPEKDAAANEPAKSFEELMAYDWTLEAGQEQYFCVFQTLTEDLWISDFRPIQPFGTHHVTLGFIDPGPPDGVIEAGDPDAEFACNGISLGDNLAYGAVYNTQGFSMPKGVASRIPAGKQLLLSVHVFNGDEDDVLSGRTGIEVVRANPDDVESEAEMVFAANVGIEVKPGESTQMSTCTMAEDATILTMLHHMHLTGVHQKTTLVTTDGKRTTLLDAPFVFEEQLTVELDPPLEVKKGDKLEVECQFQNMTDKTFTFGESTGDSEMCISVFYRYPAVSEGFLCLN